MREFIEIAKEMPEALMMIAYGFGYVTLLAILLRLLLKPTRYGKEN